MDTISRENNSLLPVIGVAVGAVALILAGISAVSISKVKATLATHEEKLSHLDDIASQASSASNKADSLRTDLNKVTNDANTAFKTVASDIGTIQAQIAKLEEGRKPAAKGGSHGPAVAGPGEYIVKPGDTLSKIARANGVSRTDLESVNPGVDSKHLKVGQKLKLPEKGSAASAPAAAPAAP